MNQLKSSLVRFIKAFIAGGVGSVILLLSSGVKITSLDDAKHIGLVVIGAFVVGGLMALEKALNWIPISGS